MISKELIRKLQHTARNDLVSEMRQLLDNDVDIIRAITAGSIGYKLLELSISHSKENHLKCAAYLISQNVDPSKAFGTFSQTGITPLHSIAFAICDATHLTSSDQREILDAIVKYEITHSYSPMCTAKMNDSSETTPYDILNPAQRNYYKQVEQQLLENQEKNSFPTVHAPAQNRNRSTVLANLTTYLFSFMSPAHANQKESRDTNSVEMQQKTIKCE